MKLVFFLFSKTISLDEHLKDVHADPTRSCLNLISISNDDFLYQCFNCKLFFASTCNFSHNCMENDGKGHVGSHANYFSPIFIKFNSSQKRK